MNNEFEGFTRQVTRGEDGVYRWYYDMDMYQNKSMLYGLLRANVFIFLLVLALGGVIMALTRQSASYIRGIAVVWLIAFAGMSLLYVVGFYIAAWIKGGEYRIHFAMGEESVEIVWPGKLVDAMDGGAQALRMLGNAVGSRTVRGRYRPSLNEVSKTRFDAVTRLKAYPQWHMIDLYMIGGKFQIYACDRDFGFVKDYVLERLSDRARAKSERGKA